MGKKMPIDTSLPKNRFWNVHEVAYRLRTTTKEIYNKVRRKTLPGARKLGRSLRFDPVKIEQWARDNEIKTYEELTP